MALAKLTEVQREEIRQKYSVGDISQRALGKLYGVAQTTIRDVLYPGCRLEYCRNYRQKNPEKVHEFCNRHLERRLWQKSKTRHNLEHSIQVSDVVIPKICPVYGIALDRYAPKLSANRPSLDRVDNTKGYIPGNVRVISWAANRDKQNLSEEKLLALAEYILDHKAAHPEIWGDK